MSVLVKKRFSMRFLTTMAILENFDEDAHGRGGHGHASKSKELLLKGKSAY
jgi:hypothetical protein